MTISKKTISAAILSGVLAFSAGAAFAWCGGYGPGPMRGQGPQVPPCVQQPGCAAAVPNAPCFQGAPQFRGYHNPNCPLVQGAKQPNRAPGARFSQGNYEERMTYLRGLLNLSDAQKPAFDAYLGALKAAHTRAPKAAPAESRQDRLAQRIERQKARLAVLEKISQTRADLVKVLTPEQASALDSFESRAHHRLGHVAQQRHHAGPRTL